MAEQATEQAIAEMQNIIFDLGGVVFHWDPDAIIESTFADPTVQRRVKEDVFTHPDWLETDRGTLSEVEAIQRFAARTGQSIEKMTELMRTTDASLTVKADTIELLEELYQQGYPLYCLSNMPRERYAYLRNQHSFWEKFSGIVVSAHVQMIKPEPTIYRHLLKTYNLAPQTCIFLDDSPPNITGAQAVGIKGIVYTTAAACRQALEVYLH